MALIRLNKVNQKLLKELQAQGHTVVLVSDNEPLSPYANYTYEKLRQIKTLQNNRNRRRFCAYCKKYTCVHIRKVLI